jgi:chemotaxis protein histidine kinase CheA
MKPKLAEMLVKSIQINSILQKRALDSHSTYHSAAQEAQTKVSSLAEHMVDKGCVSAHQKEAASDMLQSHAGTMDLLWNSVEKLSEAHTRLEKSASDLGRGVDESQAGGVSSQNYNSLDDPYVGRRTAEKKASDAAIWAVVNNPV